MQFCVVELLESCRSKFVSVSASRHEDATSLRAKVFLFFISVNQLGGLMAAGLMNCLKALCWCWLSLLVDHKVKKRPSALTLVSRLWAFSWFWSYSGRGVYMHVEKPEYSYPCLYDEYQCSGFWWVHLICARACLVCIFTAQTTGIF